MNKELKSRIIHKHDTAANWAKATNFIPNQGELIVYDIDADYTYERFKIGDGATLVSNLPFMPGPADKLLVVTATSISDNIATTDYSSEQIISHINNGGNSILLINDLTFSYATVDDNKVGYSLTMVSNTSTTSEVNTLMAEVSGKTATLSRANYDPALAGFLKDADVYDKTAIDKKVVELTEAIESATSLVDAARNVWYGTSTNGGGADKIVTTTTGDFTLKAGNVIYVKFGINHTGSSMTLNVDELGAKPVYSNGRINIASGLIASDEAVCFVYTGEYFKMLGGVKASTDNYGVVKLSSSTNNASHELAATPYAVKQAYDLANTANTAAADALSSAKTYTDEQVATKAPKTLVVSSSYDDNSNLVSDYSSDEILTHIANGGDTMYYDIDLGKFAYLRAYARKVYYGGIVIWGDTLALIVYEISGNNITNSFVSYSSFALSDNVYTKDEIDDTLALIPATYETQGSASAKLTEAKAYTDELGNAFSQIIMLMYGDDMPEDDDNFITIRAIAQDSIQSMAVTAESSDGAIYAATVPGIAALTVGTSFIMIPNMTSTTKTPTLNINGLGAKQVRRRLSNLGTSQQQGYSTNWLTANLPFRVIYDGTYWIVEGQNKPAAADLYGTPAAATKATKDGNGNVITDTYATIAYVDGLIGTILNGAS